MNIDRLFNSMLKIVILKLENKNSLLTAGWQRPYYSVSNWIQDSWQECFLDSKPGSQSWKILLIILIESKYHMCLCLGQNVSEKTVSSDSLHRWQPYTINTMGSGSRGWIKALCLPAAVRICRCKKKRATMFYAACIIHLLHNSRFV